MNINKIIILVSLGFFLLRADLVQAQEPAPVVVWEPGTKITVTIHASVDSITGISHFRYNYIIASDKSSIQDVWFFVPEYGVGISVTNFISPNEWISHLDDFAPIIYWGGVGVGKIKPGSSLSGFSFESGGLPRILNYYAQGYYPLPPPVPDGAANDSTMLEPNFFNNSVKGWTVSPGYNPTAISIGPFFNDFFTLLTRSRDLGWVSPAAYNSLDKTLTRAQKQWSAGHTHSAKAALRGVMRETERYLKEGKVTTEGYALMYYNTQFLEAHL